MILTTVHGLTPDGWTGDSTFTTGPSSAEVTALVAAMFENGCVRVTIDVAPCPHNRLLPTGAPNAHVDSEEYQYWLDSKRRCYDCGSEVANRDL
jgi:hypothetical protein